MYSYILPIPRHYAANNLLYMGNSEDGIGRIEGKKKAVGYLAETHHNQGATDVIFNDKGEVVQVDKSPKAPRRNTIRGIGLEERKEEGEREHRQVQRIDVAHGRGGISAAVSRKPSPNVSVNASPRENSTKSQLNIGSKPPAYRLKQRLDRSFPASVEFTVFPPYPPFLQETTFPRPLKHPIIQQSSYKLLRDSHSLNTSMEQVKEKRCRRGVINLSPSKKQVSSSFLSAYMPAVSRGTGSVHIRAGKKAVAATVSASPAASRPPKGSRAEQVWTWKGSHGKLRPRK